MFRSRNLGYNSEQPCSLDPDHFPITTQAGDCLVHPVENDRFLGFLDAIDEDIPGSTAMKVFPMLGNELGRLHDEITGNDTCPDLDIVLNLVTAGCPEKRISLA